MNESINEKIILFCQDCGKSSACRPSFSRLSKKGLTENERKIPFKSITGTEITWKSKIPVKGTPR